MKRRKRWRRSGYALDRLRSLRALRVLSLEGLPSGKGQTHGRIVWLCLASHLRWGHKSGRVHPNNETIARETGLTLRAVERGLAYLHKHGKIRRSYRYRGKAEYSRWGRIIHMQFEGPAPIVELPPEEELAEMWIRLRRESSRPAAAFAVALAAHVIARSKHRKIKRSRQVDESVNEIAKLLGVSRGGGFNDHLNLLRELGILDRPGARWVGFVVFGRLVEKVKSAARGLLKAASFSRVTAPEKPVDRAEAHLAAMSEAFAALYPGSGLALVG